MKGLRAIGLSLGALLGLLWLAPAAAQTAPNWTYGYVPTPAQWTAIFAAKQDYLGAAPCVLTGCTFTGKVNTVASSTANAGLNLGQGVAPTTPTNGDLWVTSAGLFVRANGTTIGPLGTGGSNTITIGGTTASTFGLTNLTMVAGNITAGTIAGQNSSAVAITGGTIAGTALNMSGTTLTNLVSPTNPLDGANKSYVDSVAGAGINPLPQTRLATAAVLPNTPTYNNGASGVGATLTAGANSTLTVDGTIANLNDVVLVKNQASAFQNGIYTVTAAGSGGAPWVLTRATYFDQAAEQKINSTSTVTAGGTLSGSTWIMNPTVTTVGTDPQNWTLFASSGVANIGGVTGPISLSAGLSMVGSVLTSAANVSTIAGQSGAFACAAELTCSGATLAFTTINANSVLANFTGGAAKPIQNAVPSCTDTAGNHLNFTGGTGFSCGTSSSYSCTMSSVSTNNSPSAALCQTILVDATAGAVTITLFASGGGVVGDIVKVKKIDATANNVIVNVSGGGNIDGVTSQVIGSQWSSSVFQVNATQWYSL